MKNLDPDKPKPEKIDSEAPDSLEIIIKDKATGDVFLSDIALQKHFSTGSVGYYLSGKANNSKSGERYQVSCNITLIGSKPKG